jgi:hypothetical protein
MYVTDCALDVDYCGTNPVGAVPVLGAVLGAAPGALRGAVPGAALGAVRSGPAGCAGTTSQVHVRATLA